MKRYRLIWIPPKEDEEGLLTIIELEDGDIPIGYEPETELVVILRPLRE